MEKLTIRQEFVLNEIKKFIASKGYSPTIRELCKICNLSSTATMFVHVRNLIEKGYLKQTENKFRTLELNVANEYAKNNDNSIEVPLLGKIAAGNPIEAIENPNEFINIPSYLVPSNTEVFSLHVNGDSMVNAGILNDDIVIIKKQKTANNGEIVAAMTEENEVTLKRFYKEKDHVRLQPENDLLDPIILSNVTILGKAIGLYRKM